MALDGGPRAGHHLGVRYCAIAAYVHQGGRYVRNKGKRGPPLTPALWGRAYFLARLAGFCFGVNGSGGLASIVRSKSSVRLFASPTGRRSILAISAARSVAVSGLCLVMVGV